jgi:hypothetical protein
MNLSNNKQVSNDTWAGNHAIFGVFEWRVSESCGCSPVAAQAAEHSSFVNSRSNIIQQNFQFMCFGNCIKVKIGRCMTNHLAAELKLAANLFFIINC